MRIQTILRVATAALLLTLVLVACSQNPVGIFASIERERQILDDERGLDNDLNVAAMTEAGGKYFIAAGTLYSRDVNDPDYEDGDLAQWTAIGGPGTTNAVVSADLGSGVRVYALYTGSTGEGVYEVDPSTLEMADTPLLETGDTGSVGDDTVASIVDIFVVSDTTDVWLVASVRESSASNDYALYVTSDGSTFAELASSAPAAPFPYAPWSDAASDGTNTAFMSSSSVLVDTDGNLGDDDLIAKTAPDLTSRDRLTGMMYDDSVGGSGLLWLADDAGHIYTSPLDAVEDWQKSASHEVSSSNDTPLPFTDFALVPVDGTRTNLVVGTRGYGYRVLGDTRTITYESAPQSPDLVVDGSNYQGSELAGAVVQTFYVDATPQSDYPVPTADGTPYEYFDGYLFFAGTTNQGLWRALSYPSDQGAVQWVRE
ncbi:MAG: hypothetical protein ACOC7V_04395 [Spirochaetota bacterium]